MHDRNEMFLLIFKFTYIFYRDWNRFLEPVQKTGSGTLENSRYCRVPGSASEQNPTFEKKVPEPVPGISKF
jgi:hypothetical protein